MATGWMPFTMLMKIFTARVVTSPRMKPPLRSISVLVGWLAYEYETAK